MTVVPTEMLSVGYYTFDTKYPPFPYMIVPMALFQDQLEYDREMYEQGYPSNFVPNPLPYEPGTLARNPLSEKQKHIMTKTKKCPDCGGKKFVTGPSAGMATNIKCVDCGAKFNMHPMGIDRI